MQRLFFFCGFLLFVSFASSQRTIDVNKNADTYAGAVNHVYTVAGVPFVMAKFAKVVEGSPFFHDQMMRGAIILSEGKEYKNVLLRLNLLESQVNYLGDKQTELVAMTPIKEVVLWDTINNRDHRFIFSAYIETYEKPEKDFYELLTMGKAELYKQHKKLMLESKPYGSATVEQTIRTNIHYFLVFKKQWIKIKKLKDLVSLYYDKKNDISKFISENKISGDTEANFIAVTAYYNQLFQK